MNSHAGFRAYENKGSQRREHALLMIVTLPPLGMASSTAQEPVVAEEHTPLTPLSFKDTLYGIGKLFALNERSILPFVPSKRRRRTRH